MPTVRSIPGISRNMPINRSYWLGSCLILCKTRVTNSSSVGFPVMSIHPFCLYFPVSMSVAPVVDLRAVMMLLMLQRTLSYPVDNTKSKNSIHSSGTSASDVRTFQSRTSYIHYTHAILGERNHVLRSVTC